MDGKRIWLCTGTHGADWAIGLNANGQSLLCVIVLDMTKETTVDEFLMHAVGIEMIMVWQHGLRQHAQGTVGMA